jgi:hypothetical protein
VGALALKNKEGKELKAARLYYRLPLKVHGLFCSTKRIGALRSID